MSCSKKTICLSISKELYRKIHTIHMIKKYFFENKEYTISSMIEDAVNEYLDKHNGEIQMMMDEYHKNGGCAEI